MSWYKYPRASWGLGINLIRWKPGVWAKWEFSLHIGYNEYVWIIKDLHHARTKS